MIGKRNSFIKTCVVDVIGDVVGDADECIGSGYGYIGEYGRFVGVGV